MLKYLHYLVPLPVDASAQGPSIDIVMYLIHLLMYILFIGWGIYFTIALVKFCRKHNPKANYHGVHSRASTAAEIGVIVAEALLLVGFSIPFWAQNIDTLPKGKDVTKVEVVAQQFSWNIHYPGKDGKFGKINMKYFDATTNPLGLDPNDPAGKDDFIVENQLHVPVGHPVLIYLSSKDVIHSLWIPAMRVKQDAIPGERIPMWFTPTHTGHYDIACAQLCGIGHYRMRGTLIVESEKKYKKWLNQEESELTASSKTKADHFWN